MGGDHRPVSSMKDSGLLVKEMLIKGWDPVKDYHELQKERMCDIVFKRLFSYDPDGLGELEFEFNKAVPIAKLDRMTNSLKKACPTASIWVRRFVKPPPGSGPSRPAIAKQNRESELQWKTPRNTSSDLQWKIPTASNPRRQPTQPRKESQLQWKTSARSESNELEWKTSPSSPVLSSRANQIPTRKKKRSTNSGELIWRTEPATDSVKKAKLKKRSNQSQDKKPRKKKSANYISVIMPKDKPEANPFGISIKKKKVKGKKLTVFKMDKKKIPKPITKPLIAIPDRKVRHESSRLRPSQIVERKLREEQAAREHERQRILARSKRKRKRASNLRHQAITRRPAASRASAIPWYDDGPPEQTVTPQISEPVANNYPRSRTSTRVNDYSDQAVERKLMQQRQRLERKQERMRESTSESASSSEDEYEASSGSSPIKEELRKMRDRCEINEEQSNNLMSLLISEKFAALEKISGPGKKRRRTARAHKKAPSPKKSSKVPKPHIFGTEIEPVNSVAGGCFKIKPKAVTAGPTKAMSLDSILDNLF